MAEERPYTTVAREASSSFEEKRSLFIGYAKHTETEEEAAAFVRAIREKHKDATHNVFAYTMKGGILCRYSDDGEPQGTAGMPMLEVIRKSAVDDVCVVVTRYFGGILLGAGGLVRAYGNAAGAALAAAGIVTLVPYLEFSLSLSYADYEKFRTALERAGALTEPAEFGAEVLLRFAVKEKDAPSVLSLIGEMSAGKTVPREVGRRLGPAENKEGKEENKKVEK